jgi:hypothetical protein
MPLTKHVTGQKKPLKIQGPLANFVKSAQNIAHTMEAPVRFQTPLERLGGRQFFGVATPKSHVAIEGA